MREYIQAASTKMRALHLTEPSWMFELMYTVCWLAPIGRSKSAVTVPIKCYLCFMLYACFGEFPLLATILIDILESNSNQKSMKKPKRKHSRKMSILLSNDSLLLTLLPVVGYWLRQHKKEVMFCGFNTKIVFHVHQLKHVLCTVEWRKMSQKYLFKNIAFIFLKFGLEIMIRLRNYSKVAGLTEAAFICKMLTCLCRNNELLRSFKTKIILKKF